MEVHTLDGYHVIRTAENLKPKSAPSANAPLCPNDMDEIVGAVPEQRLRLADEPAEDQFARRTCGKFNSLSRSIYQFRVQHVMRMKMQPVTRLAFRCDDAQNLR